MPSLTSDVIAIIIAIVLAILILIGVLMFLQRRRAHRRVVQNVAAQLDEEFGVKDETRFKSFDDEFDPQDAREIWLHGNDKDRL